MTAQSTKNFREEFRRKNLSPNYSSPAHLTLTVGSTLAVMLAPILMLDHVRPLEW